MTLKLYLDNPEIEPGFEAVRASLPGADLPGLNMLRGDAMSRFVKSGIPGPKVEEWKYTNLNFLAKENFQPAAETVSSEDVKSLFDKAYMKDIAGPVVVFVNGHINTALSSYPDEKGLAFTVLSENAEVFQESLKESEKSGALNNLNQALVTDGYQMKIAAGTQLKQPVQIVHIATSSTDMKSLRTRVRIEAGENAKAEIIETFIGPEGIRYWSHMVSDINLAKGADVTIYQFQRQGKQAIHMTELHSSVSDQAKFSHISLQLGAEVSRTEIINSFTGEFAHVELRGAYLGRVKQSHDIFTRINHDTPNCQSNQLFRGVLDEGGTSAFQGKVVVARDAQKTNADQSNKNLLLSRKAEANCKPELLIYADDVKCTHGATVGELDSDHLFYLRSRGLDEVAAKGLLVEAFVSGVFDEIEDENLRTSFRDLTSDWLSHEVTP